MRIVCKKCHGSLSVFLSETISVPKDCPICKQQWQDAKSSGSSDVAESLGNAVKHWLTTEREKQPTFTLHFEIVSEP